MNKIPGLRKIWDNVDELGRPALVFEIDDDKVGDFYAAFGLQTDDKEGLSKVIEAAIRQELDRSQPNER